MCVCVCVCVCVLVFSAGIPEWSCWRKINFMLTFMFLWICTDVSEQKEMGPGLYVVTWSYWALYIRASVIRFLSKCGKVAAKSLWARQNDVQQVLVHVSVCGSCLMCVTGDGLVSKSCLCTPRSSDWRGSTGSRSCLLCFKWVHEANFHNPFKNAPSFTSTEPEVYWST